MWSQCLFLFLITISLINVKNISGQEKITLRTRLGNISGIQLKNFTIGGVSKGNLYRFSNIPFGKPPVGQLRFAKPQPFGSWHGILDATIKGPACYQSPSKNFNGTSEDCLQLNIYVPHSLAYTNSKSVMVWIHGGGYIGGSGTTDDASMFALTGDVIVVTVNYRLGIFGFIASSDPDARGNAGLWDQMMALDWIRYNIRDYGGNPASVTIYGESAGGYSVSLLSLIPRNRGLFQRVIAQSGVANSYRALSNFTFISTTKVAEKVGCLKNLSSTNDRAMVQCLRQIDAKLLLEATRSYRREIGLKTLSYLPFTPVVDGELFRKEPSLLLKDKASSEFNFFQSLDMMIGNCNNEGSLHCTTGPSASSFLYGRFLYRARGIHAKRSFTQHSGINNVSVYLFR
ncbi:carboxylesterase 1E-like [Saccostrea echinata]|uniref:carboxylesterase 1E-like n=1 Tax=Saccostrea echinata TaxID=191078 RepID=UPI002A8236A7|nr:carboxylesterase 1E-like [Saccostrea echinata]